MSIFKRKSQQEKSEHEEKLKEEMCDKFKDEKDFIDNLPKERREQLRLFKIIFPIFFVVFFISVFFGFYSGLIIQILSVEAAIALVSLALYKFNPFKAVYPNCFLMPVFAFLICLVVAVTGWFGIGKTYREWGNEKESHADLVSSDAEDLDSGGFSSSSDFSDIEEAE